MEKKVTTSVGQETASETLARISKAAEAWNKPQPKTEAPSKSDAVLNMLTERLTQQGKGISTSASSNLQASINEAIASTQKAGELGAQRLQSEREREVSFAQDRAGATYTTALEGRTGYGTQVAALRELTETTEKSVRDLDKRYQEAILANDSATASTIAGMQMKKLEFQQQQEESFFRNMLQVADITSREEQFYQSQKAEADRFSKQMAQSDDQFKQNLGIQYKELDLQSQELDIARERNQISWSELAAKKAELNKNKTNMTLKASLYDKMYKEVREKGVSPSNLDPLTIATDMTTSYLQMGVEIDFEDTLQAAQVAQAEIVSKNLAPFTANTGGINESTTAFKRDVSNIPNSISNILKSITPDYFTKPI